MILLMWIMEVVLLYRKHHEIKDDAVIPHNTYGGLKDVGWNIEATPHTSEAAAFPLLSRAVKNAHVLSSFRELCHWWIQ